MKRKKTPDGIRFNEPATNIAIRHTMTAAAAAAATTAV